MYVTVFNTTDSPVVVSERGNTVGGGEWATADTTDSVAAAALEAGTLVKVDQPDEITAEHAPAASQVLEQTDRYAKRHEALKDKDKPELLKIAKKAGLVNRDEDPLREDLERTLVTASVELPELEPTATAKKAAAKKTTS